MTLARNHFQRESAARAAALSGAEASTVQGTVYELALNQLAQAQRQLSAVQSIERKVELKRQLLPAFDAYVEGALEGGRGAQDDVLTTVMMWRIDTGDIAGALPVAAYALQHGLRLPERYKRTLPTALAEEAAETALQRIQAGSAPALDDLYGVDQLTEDRDMPDEVRAKLHKALGLGHEFPVDDEDAAEAITRLKAALKHLNRALVLHDKVGVKKDIERIERELKQASANAG
ncbi:phage terminase small subunit [Lysobacter arvi]|uniref:Phage terminase small subunit n=1 Tax=Lysobacter arvi TaxID=3038776 RepID=A0ABU1CB24_9GAMM|nr:phage terminase small subunit [Lysobacter arvi]MDR0182398.1 phage terminase small subunit [Lysobacter arvi]